MLWKLCHWFDTCSSVQMKSHWNPFDSQYYFAIVIDIGDIIDCLMLMINKCVYFQCSILSDGNIIICSFFFFFVEEINSLNQTMSFIVVPIEKKEQMLEFEVSAMQCNAWCQSINQYLFTICFWVENDLACCVCMTD